MDHHDTGFPKKGTHSVRVARQYCGQLGKQDNCQVAVSLSVATWNSSLPIAYRLYLPEEWSKDSKRRKPTGVPEEIQFQTKPQIALDQIRQAVGADLPLASSWQMPRMEGTVRSALASLSWVSNMRWASSPQ
jgi:SRSO17 transposase